MNVIEIDEQNDQVVLRPDFDLTAGRTGEIRAAVMKLAAPDKTLILDLANVRNMDSMGLGVVVSCLKSIKQLGGNFHVKTSDPDILTLFELLRLEHILTSTR